MHNDEAKIVTRMVIAPDGNGYAITNDANTFIRFSTGKKPTRSNNWEHWWMIHRTAAFLFTTVAAALVAI